MLIENSFDIDETKNNSSNQLVNFADCLLQNAVLSRLESFDYTCPLNERSHEKKTVSMRLWEDLTALKSIGTIKQFYLRQISSQSGTQLLSSADPALDWLKEFMIVRNRNASFKWPREVNSWDE